MKKTISIFIATFLSIPAILLICVACAFLSAFIYNQRIETFKTNVTNLEYYIESTYEDQIVSIEDTIHSPIVSSFVLDPTNEVKRDQARGLLFNTFTVEDSALEIGIVSLDGNVLLSSSNSIIEPNQSETVVFKKVIETNKPYCTMRFYENYPILKIGYPIFSGNNLVGVYLRYTPLNYINYFARNLSVESEDIYLMTKDNSGIIFNSNGENHFVNPADAQKEGLSSDLEKLDDILKSAQSEDEGTVNFYLNNQNIIGYYKIISDLNWICMICQPRAIILYDLNLFQLITLIVTFAFIFVINFGVKRFFSKYINILTNMSNQMKDFLNGNKFNYIDLEDQPEPLLPIAEDINKLFEKSAQLDTTNKELSQQLDSLLTRDPITNLLNNKALYQAIGNSIVNRLFEIITDVIKEIEDENFYSSRIAQDNFVIFVNSFENLNSINETLNELRVRLKAITKVDDLEIELNPNIVAVFRDDHLLGRSDWLRLATEVLEDSQTKKGSFTIFDLSSLNELIHENPQFIDNILLKDNNAIEGFSQSFTTDE